MTENATPSPRYRFGDRIEVIAASHDNPRKFGLYIRNIVRNSRSNGGEFIEMTDGNGDVWITPPDNVRAAPVSPTPAPAGWMPIDPPDALIEAMAEAYEASHYHDLIGPMGDAYRALVNWVGAAPVSAPVAAQPFQQRVQPWMVACFGEQIAADTMERNHRFLEEALELVQACGCTASEAHQLVDYVYGRPVGERSQEVGGVVVTLAALCLAQGLDMHDAGETELARIWTKVEQIRAKQAAKPKNSPLPGPSAGQTVALQAQPSQDVTADVLTETAKLIAWGHWVHFYPRNRFANAEHLWPALRDREREGYLASAREVMAARAVPAPAEALTGVLAEVAAERRRQIEVEGWTPEHDDEHTDGEMAAAAATYALHDIRGGWFARWRDVMWPWNPAWWKPKDRRRDLIRAGALIVAELERIDRAALRSRQAQGEG